VARRWASIESISSSVLGAAAAAGVMRGGAVIGRGAISGGAAAFSRAAGKLSCRPSVVSSVVPLAGSSSAMILRMEARISSIVGS